MPNFTVFYAWQNDTPTVANRYFIRDALQSTIKQLKQSAEIDSAPRLDHDTAGVSGTPEIASTILNKIERCGIFLGDVTFVGKACESADSGTKLLPNPNVLLELGYALRHVGSERIVLVMNTVFGAPDELPFDLRHRRHPIQYSLSPTATPSEIAQASETLAIAFAQAIKAVAKKVPTLGVDPNRKLQIRVSPTRQGRRQLAGIHIFNAGDNPFYIAGWHATWVIDGRQSASTSFTAENGVIPKRLLGQDRLELLVDISRNPVENLTALGIVDGEHRFWNASEDDLRRFIHVAVQHQLPPRKNEEIDDAR